MYKNMRGFCNGKISYRRFQLMGGQKTAGTGRSLRRQEQGFFCKAKHPDKKLADTSENVKYCKL